jgi:hypothetical protein
MVHEDPLQEASDPSTDPARLRELARQKEWAVLLVVWRNPSLPEDVWREGVLSTFPETWANPMAPFYLLTWTPRQEDAGRTLVYSIRQTTVALWREPERCSAEGKALLAAQVQAWWATSEESEDMIDFIGEWAKAKGDDSTEHREVVRIVLLCVRTAPDLTDEDRQALDLLETWTAGGADQRKEADRLASSNSVKKTVRFSWEPLTSLLSMIPRNPNRRLADLIRSEMPLPPVVA